jgi:hypothetical protein
MAYHFDTYYWLVPFSAPVLQRPYYFFAGACRGERFYYFYNLMPSLDNINLKPMVRFGVLCQQWGQWMGGCFDWYALLHNWTIDRKPIQALLGHNDLKTTMRYLRTTNRNLLKIISPPDDLNL